MVETNAPAEAVETPTALLEEGDDLGQSGEGLHPVTGIPSTSRISLSRVALLASGGGRDHLGDALWTARSAKSDLQRKQNLMKGGHMMPPSPNSWPKTVEMALT